MPAKPQYGGVLGLPLNRLTHQNCVKTTGFSNAGIEPNQQMKWLSRQL
jgi:hypothetical protein